MPTFSQLNKGLNLWGWTASVNMEPGEALDAQDCIYRLDGSVMKHWGWERVTESAASARPLALRSFNYKGKNNNEAVNPARAGNLGIADGGAAIFTRRTPFYSGAIMLTETECLRWEPATKAFVSVSLPAGTTVDIRSKPTVLFIQNNLYIVGWATNNLRYDPVDEALYVWGWDNLPANAGHAGVAAGGSLLANATYQYRLSWIDMFTGEESGLSVAYSATTTSANRTVTLDNFVAYGGARHFVDGANLTNNDIGIVVYRTDPDGEAFYFLDLVPPGVAAATVTDNGLSVDYSVKAEVRTYEDMPLLDGACQFRSMILGFSWASPPTGNEGQQAKLTGNSARVYYNDFRGEKSFIERWDVLNYKELPLDDGEILTAIQKTPTSVFLASNTNCYGMDVVPSYNTGRINIQVHPYEWTVGCVGPQAAKYADGYLYFLSDRGPYRWRPGTLNPDFIGRNLTPMFIDQASGLCQLTEQLRLESEVFYDQDADVVRWIFPAGSATVLNRHLTYAIRGDQYGLKFYQGWSFCSPQAQCFDYGNAYHGLVGGLPATPFDARPRLVFGDDNGFVNQYQPDSTRGGAQPGFASTGTAQATSTVNTLVTLGGLPTTGDGLDFLRLEVVHTDGTIDIRTIASNDATDIAPDEPFSQAPDGGTWYVAGIPFFWRSWVDSVGDPSIFKDLIHMHVGYNRQFVTSDHVTDVEVAGAAEWPLTSSRTRTVTLDKHRAKLLIAIVGRFFTYEMSNSRPDEPFLMTWLKTNVRPLGERA